MIVIAALRSTASTMLLETTRLVFHLGVAFSSTTWNASAYKDVDRRGVDVDEEVLLADPRSDAGPRSDAVVCVSRLPLSLLDYVPFVGFVAVASIRHGVVVAVVGIRHGIVLVADADAVFRDCHCRSPFVIVMLLTVCHDCYCRCHYRIVFRL